MTADHADVRRPASSEPFARERRAALARPVPVPVDREAVFGGSSGCGVTVAIVDSGIERDHPAVGGRVVGGVRVVVETGGPRVVDDDDPTDPVGHGTASAGIVHALAPAADLVSVRVLGPDNRAPGLLFATAIEWLVAESIPVANLSPSSRKETLFGAFHDLADAAYFGNTLLVCAANNLTGPSYPSLFASVVSVAAHDVPDPWTWFYNPRPPVEFGAWGVDVPVAWNKGSRIVATGNSLAAPHVAGLSALVRQRYPRATPFEVKALLAATSTSSVPGRAERPDRGGGCGAVSSEPERPFRAVAAPALRTMIESPPRRSSVALVPHWYASRRACP